MRVRETLFMCMLGLAACTPVDDKKDTGLTYIMDMVHNNPGEPVTETKYNNPEFVKEVGFNGMCPQWHVQCALTYDSFDKGIIPEGSKEREWILNKQADIKQKLQETKKAGMKIYPFTDVMVVPTIVLEKYANEIMRYEDKGLEADACKGKLIPDIHKEKTQEIFKAQLNELFDTFPELDGLNIRFGETYLFDTPYHSGGNPVRTRDSLGIAGHVKLLNLLREEVCVKRNKKVFYRTWGGFLHTITGNFIKVTNQVEPHPNLVFSIKYTDGDFHRCKKFNPTIARGKHDYIIEFQGQPEYYGKGSHPVYLFGSVLNGFSEYSQLMKEDQVQSLNDLKKDPHFKGLWTWSRGGGWRGPYISNELWCDVNTLSAAVWAQDTTQTEKEVLEKSLPMVGVEKESIPMFIDLLHKADRAVLIGQCTEIDLKKSGFNVWWTRDQYFSNENSLSKYMNYIITNGKQQQMLDEKEEAVRLWKEIEDMSRRIKMTTPEQKSYLEVSSTYGRIKHELIAQMFTIFMYGKMGETGELNKPAIKNAIERYDSLWDEWKELKANHPDCATLYEPNAFRITADKGVSGNPDNGIGSTVDKYRKMVK